jgi:hypothetical protein
MPSENPLSGEGPAEETSRLPATSDSDQGSSRPTVTALAENPRRSAERRVVTAIGLVVSSALIVYLAAGGLQNRKPPGTATQAVAPSAASASASPLIARFVPPASPLNPPPLEDTRASVQTTPSPTSNKAIAVGRNDHRTVHRRQVQRSQPFFAKARAFLRKIF